jgi:hypothetical protein
MRILILPSARDDLADGFAFYERQEAGLGNYFLESLFSDIESLRLYAGIHPKQFGSSAPVQAFPLRRLLRSTSQGDSSMDCLGLQA